VCARWASSTCCIPTSWTRRRSPRGWRATSAHRPPAAAASISAASRASRACWRRCWAPSCRRMPCPSLDWVEVPESRAMPTRTVLLYAQDTRGLGHITRTLTIARHVLAAHPDVVAYIATRSHFAHSYTLPERCDYVKLPSRQIPKSIQLPPDDDELSKDYFRKLRGVILRDAALGLAPDLVLVDHEPLGTNGEFSAGLWALKAESPHTRFVFGLRDIMDDAERIRAQWEELGV